MAAVGCLPRCQAAAGVKQEHVTCWPKVFLRIVLERFELKLLEDLWNGGFRWLSFRAK